MKKLLLSLTAFMLCTCSFAQNPQAVKTIYDLKPKGPANHTVNPKMYSGEEISSGTTGMGPVKNKNAAKTNLLSVQPIGSTTYDLQSNAAAVCGRMYSMGTTVGAGWTYSNDLNPVWLDRGTAVNYSFDNGATWGPFPTARVENERRGFGTLDKLGAGEVVFSHGWTATNPIPMCCYYRATAGSGSWSKISDIPGPQPGFIECLWPAMRTGGANGNSIHAIAITVPTANSAAATQYLGVDGMLLYYRSEDGGLTWNVQNFQLPEMDSLHYVRVRANAYSIDVRGNVVAIVMSGTFDDWILWKSTDNGTTWNKTVIYDFPFTRYNYDTDTTDVDHDGIPDTIPTTDGTCAVVIDNNNVAHCFSGSLSVCQTMGGTANILAFTDQSAILYWNENMGANPAIVSAQAHDFNNDGIINDFSAGYGFVDGSASMPTVGVDASNSLYLAFSAVMELTDNGSGVNYRNIYACKSNDNGLTWSQPLNISNDDFLEGVYPAMPRDVVAPDCLHLMWQSDDAPGTTANAATPASSSCQILYDCVDPIALGITVNQNSASADVVKISPNPASTYIMLNYNLKKAAKLQSTVVNALGQSVYYYESNMTSGKNSVKVDLKNFSAGVYTVNTTIGETKFNSKFVVEK